LHVYCSTTNCFNHFRRKVTFSSSAFCTCFISIVVIEIPDTLIQGLYAITIPFHNDHCHLVSQDGDKNEHADADSLRGHVYLVSPEINTIYTSVIKIPLSVIVAV